MNNFFKRFSIIFILTLLFSLPVFSQDWYLCVGSFKNEKNAQTLVESLKYNGFDSVIDNYEKDSELYYRVLLAQSYSDRNLARSKIKDIEKDPIIKKLKISGIWICTASDKITKKVETQTPLDVTKELVIEKETEKKTTKTVETNPKTSEKTSSKTKATESTKKSDKTSTSKKTTKKSSAKTETKPAVTDAKSVATVEKVEVKPIEEELPPIEDEVYDSDLLSQAKKYEKEIAEKNKIAEKTTVSEEPAKESAKETDKEVIPETVTENETEKETESEAKVSFSVSFSVTVSGITSLSVSFADS
nr:SPOR domain-containing protein [Treponema sp.]